MLGSGKVVKAVADFLAGVEKDQAGESGGNSARRAACPISFSIPSLSPLRARTFWILPGTRSLIEKLIPLADVVTPNLDEAEALTGIEVRNLDDMKAACRQTPWHGCESHGNHRRPSRQSHRPAEFHQNRPRSENGVPAGAGNLQGRAAALKFDPRHRMCLLDGHGLPPGARSWLGGSCPAGQDLRHSRDRHWTSAGKGNRTRCIIFTA